MKILLTGNKGYIGQVVEKKLFEAGHNVIGLDIADVNSMDVRYVQTIEADAVIHLAGMSSDPQSEMDPRMTDLVNHRATERLAKIAKESGVRRFIFASTCSVYFTWEPKNIEYTEEDAINPVSVYAISKRQAEMALLELHNHQFEPVIFRFGTVYGLSPNMRTDTIVNHLVEDAVKKSRMTLMAGGKIYRPLADIEDVADCMITALTLPDIGGEIFNLANDNWEALDLARAVARLTKADIDILAAGVARNYKADSSKIKHIFNWQPKRTFVEAITELYTYYKNEMQKT